MNSAQNNIKLDLLDQSTFFSSGKMNVVPGSFEGCTAYLLQKHVHKRQHLRWYAFDFSG